MLQRLELDRASHDALLAECRKQGVQFLSTAFDDESIDLLKEYPMPFWKIPSGELTNLPYLRRIGAMGGKIVLSTGMATLSDIEAALTALIKAGTRQDDMTILHCSTEYPTPWGDVNLKAMETIRDAFKIAVGYSDHTRGIEVPIAAVALGATIIEKHFTMNRDLPGPDHAASLEPGEFRMMANAIRNIEIALGSGIKKPSETELQNRLFARKSLVAKRTITKGETIMPDAITAKRPGSGLSPMLIDLLVGTIARRDFNPDELMEL
jgi:N,N'-diacetyllegionaminate synthase